MSGHSPSQATREKIRRALSGRTLPSEIIEARMTTAPYRRAKIPHKDTPVGGWIEKLRLALQVRRRYHPKVSEDSLALLAGHLALLGPVVEGESKINEVYAELLTLFFSWRRVQDLPTNLRLLTADPVALTKIADAVKASRKIEDAEKASFPVAAFIAIALKVKDPVAYVEVCMKEGHKFIRGAFSAGAYDHIERRYRGVVGDLASAEHREEVRTRLRTVR